MDHKKLKKVKDKKKQYILDKYEGVQGIGISEKIRNGKKTGELALTIYVERKINPMSLSDDERIDLDPNILRELDSDQHIDIKAIGKIRKLVPHTARIRPVETGISEGHYQITAGTGGILVQDRITGKVLRLSNNHVYANENRAQLDDAIYQPGPYDGGRSVDLVGILERFVPIDFDGDNKVDAAVRTTTHDELQILHNIGGIPAKMSAAKIGQAVVKSGRTTGVTTGIISDVSADLNIGYDGGDVWFVDQILIESSTPFSQGGDSGSTICLDTDELDWIGILFAGSDDGLFTIGNHATDVYSLLNVELHNPNTTEPGPAPEPEPSVEKISWWRAVLNFFITLFRKLFGM